MVKCDGGEKRDRSSRALARYDKEEKEAEEENQEEGGKMRGRVKQRDKAEGGGGR